jgi:hypothetical protein
MKRALGAVGLVAAVVVGGAAPAFAEVVAGVVASVDPERRAVMLEGDPRTYLMSRVMPLIAEPLRIVPGDRVLLTFERNADIDVVVHVEGDGTDLRAAQRAPTGAQGALGALVLDAVPFLPADAPARIAVPLPPFGPLPPAGGGGDAAVAAVPVPGVAVSPAAPAAGAPTPLVPQVAGTVMEMNAATRTVMLDNGQSFRVDANIGMATLRPGNRVVLRLGERNGQFLVVQVIPG